ncbi:MAG: formylglycine-generating enzyme family protein [Loktanella sp.]|nr:formylglycine-generating enzyme family protein [Loktanella sp.]
MSGGDMTVRFTASGQPSYFYRMRKFNVQDLDASLGTGVHPAFVVGGVEKDEILVGVHQAAEVGGEMVSQAGLVPRVNRNHDQAVTLARNTGAGFCVATTPMYAALALLARSDFRFPRGNNDDGRAYDAPDEFGVDDNGNPTEGGGATVIRAGSGPVTWNYPPTPFGVQNLNGNVWEWSPGQRIVDGEIQIIADNDAVLAATDLSTTGPWQAIDKDTGALVAPGSAGTVHYAESGTAAGTLVCSSGSAFSSMTAHGVGAAALERLKQYGLMQPGSPIESDGFNINMSGERLPLRGGRWAGGSGAGVFALDLSSARSVSGTIIGFRPAFVI